MTNPLAGVRGRVTFAVLAVAAVVFSLLGTLGFLFVARSGRDTVRERIDAVLEQLEATMRANPGAVELRTADGVSASALVASAPVPEPAAGEVVESRRAVVGGTEVLLVGRASEARLSDSLHALFRGLWLAIPVASVVCALLAGLATSRALRPVGAITALAGTIGSAPDGQRVPVASTGDEIERLAVTVNGMLDRIDHGRMLQRRFTSDAAHELRTPLMALQGELELAEGDARAVDPVLLLRLQGIAGRLGERIDDLVLLSTLDERRAPARRPVDLLALARDEATATAPAATVAGDAGEVAADPALAARAVRNLLANARRHAASRIEVTVALDADRAWVHVDDDGPGIAPGRRADVFARFARLDEARTTDAGGSGLGLAIVASVAAAHGGGVAAGDGPLGGARLSLWFPRTPSPADT